MEKIFRLRRKWKHKKVVAFRDTTLMYCSFVQFFLLVCTFMNCSVRLKNVDVPEEEVHQEDHAHHEEEGGDQPWTEGSFTSQVMLCMYLCVRVCVYLCACVCACVYIHLIICWFLFVCMSCTILKGGGRGRHTHHFLFVKVSKCSVVEWVRGSVTSLWPGLSVWWLVSPSDWLVWLSLFPESARSYTSMPLSEHFCRS